MGDLKMMAGGLPGMLKHGAEHHTGVQDAIIRNLEACKQLTSITRTSLGPNGMNKMIINHLEKLFVTSDSATILKEMEVQHPAAKMLVLAAHMQEQEIGDGTNLVVTFGGEALHQAEELLRKGLKPAEIISGYNMAHRKTLEFLETLSTSEVKNVRDVEATDTKGTVMIKNADDLKSYNKSEE